MLPHVLIDIGRVAGQKVAIGTLEPAPTAAVVTQVVEDRLFVAEAMPTSQTLEALRCRREHDIIIRGILTEVVAHHELRRF